MDEIAWQLVGAQQFGKPGIYGAGQRLVTNR